MPTIDRRLYAPKTKSDPVDRPLNSADPVSFTGNSDSAGNLVGIIPAA